MRVARGKDLTTKDKMIVGPLLVLCVAYYARGALAGRSQTPVLDARDAETLKSVFFSGAFSAATHVQRRRRWFSGRV